MACGIEQDPSFTFETASGKKCSFEEEREQDAKRDANGNSLLLSEIKLSLISLLHLNLVCMGADDEFIKSRLRPQRYCFQWMMMPAVDRTRRKLPIVRWS